jgi:hypothetical protein
LQRGLVRNFRGGRLFQLQHGEHAGRWRCLRMCAVRCW